VAETTLGCRVVTASGGDMGVVPRDLCHDEGLTLGWA
jgi:hypothetical protein